MKVLITGASGFVGKALLAESDARGFETIAVGGPQSTSCDYSIDIGDASGVDTLSREQDVDAVVHAAGIAHRFAGVSDDKFHRVNVHGVENIASLARDLGAKHLLLFSSTLVYGRRSGEQPVSEDDTCAPADAY